MACRLEDRRQNGGGAYTTAIGLLAALLLCFGAAANGAPVLPGGPPRSGIDTLPDAGALQRNQQRQQEYQNNPSQSPQAPQPVLRDERQETDLSGAASTVRFLLKGLVIEPASHYLSDAELRDITERHVGKEVNYNDLQKTIGEINALYRRHDVLTARAILPPQHVANGIVHIRLVEGKLGKTSIEGNKTMRSSWIDNWLGMRPGQPLDTNELERHIELFNHVNDTRIEASLRPGESFGNTDLSVQAKEPPRYQLRVFADNEGVRSVGDNEAGLDGAINNLLGIGDRLGLYYTHSSGSDSGALNYSLPVNHLGGRLGLSFSDLANHVISGPYQDYDVRGRSWTGQVQFSQPIAHRGAWWLDGTLIGSDAKSNNEILGADLSNDTVYSAGAGLVVTGLYDTSTFSFAITNKYNWISSDTEDNRQADIWQFTGSWIQKITAAQYSVVRAGAQESSGQLLSPTLAMQLGGNSTVRGYPLGAIAGDDGYYVNLEWHYRMIDRVTGFVFADFGGVRTNDTPDQNISSAGIGLDVTLPYGVTFNITAGHPFETVIPDQNSLLITGRLSWQIF